MWCWQLSWTGESLKREGEERRDGCWKDSERETLASALQNKDSREQHPKGQTERSLTGGDSCAGTFLETIFFWRDRGQTFVFLSSLLTPRMFSSFFFFGLALLGFGFADLGIQFNRFRRRVGGCSIRADTLRDLMFHVLPTVLNTQEKDKLLL